MMRRQSARPSPRWLILAAAVLLAPAAAWRSPSRAAPPSPILDDLRRFRVFATVLHVGAHPDDENTQLVAYLARGRAYRAAYLSVTRGDGGQNLLSGDLGERLGVARTQELLAARRIDGGQQFFTRALDYGFSKDVNEALSTWDHQQVLRDVVRVIRQFRPDVIVTVFSTQPGGTHGHHTASAVLATEAFKLAGDSTAFPDQLKTLKPWQPKRIFQGGRGGGQATVRVDIGGIDSATGESFASIAGRSRAMHKTQGFGQGGGGGGGRGGGGGPNLQGFILLDGAPASNDIMDGIDTTWNRIPAGGADVAAMANDVMARFNPQDPSASVAALFAIRAKVATLQSDPVIEDKKRLLDRIIAECLDLTVETTIAQPELVPGEKMTLHERVTVTSRTAVSWTGMRYPAVNATRQFAQPFHPAPTATFDAQDSIRANTPLTQPYWLREEGTAGMFRVDDASLIGRPESPPAFPVDYVFDVGGQPLVVPSEPVQASTASLPIEQQRTLAVISPAPMRFTSGVGLFAPGSTHPVSVELTASRAGVGGTLQLDAPASWKVSPVTQTFRLAGVGSHATVTFNVTAPAQDARAAITAHATIGGARYSTERVEINYAHIPFQLLQPRAKLNATALTVATRGKAAGYVPGAGDDIPEALTQLGYSVTTLSAANATPERLKGLDVVVIGIRAFNVRTDLDTLMPALFRYVEQGGTVVEQYNQNGNLKSRNFAPYPLQFTSASERITEENSPVTFLAPDHPALTAPNRITSADFDGWVQERGTYFPSQWDEHFTPILSMKDSSDPKPYTNSLLVAKYGSGYFVETGIVFFRELPAGVPGAFRLFANLLALGKSGAQ